MGNQDGNGLLDSAITSVMRASRQQPVAVRSMPIRLVDKSDSFGIHSVINKGNAYVESLFSVDQPDSYSSFIQLRPSVISLTVNYAHCTNSLETVHKKTPVFRESADVTKAGCVWPFPAARLGRECRLQRCERLEYEKIEKRCRTKCAGCGRK